MIFKLLSSMYKIYVLTKTLSWKVRDSEFYSVTGGQMQLGLQVTNDLVVGFSLVTRVQTTLRGSADDIGWLQRVPGALPVEDGTSEFLQALNTIRLVHCNTFVQAKLFCRLYLLRLCQLRILFLALFKPWMWSGWSSSFVHYFRPLQNFLYVVSVLWLT